MRHLFKLALLLSISTFSYADKLDPDFSQPLTLSGDFLKLNLNSGNGEYKGSFVATQGSMRLEGNALKLEQKKNMELDRITASGQPVRFSKRNYQTGETVNGSAQKIIYDANKLLIILEGNAKITSDQGKSMQGGMITYGLTSGEIVAKGNGVRRVQIIIPPNSAKESVPLIPMGDIGSHISEKIKIPSQLTENP